MYAVPVVDPVDQCNLILPSQENSSFATLGQSFGWSGSVFENILFMLEILKFRSSSPFHVTIWMARELKRILYQISFIKLCGCRIGWKVCLQIDYPGQLA